MEGQPTRSSSFTDSALTDPALAMSAAAPRRSETFSESPVSAQMQSRGYRRWREPHVGCLRVQQRRWVLGALEILRAWGSCFGAGYTEQARSGLADDETRVGPFLLKKTDARSQNLGCRSLEWGV